MRCSAACPRGGWSAVRAGSRHQFHHDGVLVKTFHPELTAQQVQVLELMELTPRVYTQLT